MAEADSKLGAQIDQLRRELVAVRAWCVGLEQQQAQLASLLALVAPHLAGHGLTRFPLVAALADERPAQGPR